MAQDLSNGKKWLVSLMAGLLFLIISSPIVYKLVNSLTSLVRLKLADKNGCPNVLGLLVHTVVFVLLVRLLMLIKV